MHGSRVSYRISHIHSWLAGGRLVLNRYLLWSVLGLCAWAISNQASAADTTPNVVIFLADDLGWGDLACFGNPRIKTPNLDKFATQGLKLTQCYAASGVCSPSRSAILTGRTPYRNGVFTWIPEGREPHLRRTEITMTKLLRDKGYATCHSGKWHLNGYFNDPRHPQPNDHGYDWWMATQNNAHPSHKNPSNFVRNGEPVGETQGFSAELVVDEAITWLKDKRDKQKPFFLTVWTHEPHLPIESDPKFQELYSDLPDPDQRQHHGNITQMDDAFGRLMAALDDQKLTDSTFVAFTSDNGPEGDGVKARNRGSTGGLRGRKRDVYEGGIRVPGIIRWPGHVKANTTSDVPVIGSDLFATVCEITHTPQPSDRVIDGGSLVPLFEGEAEVKRQRPLYWRCIIAANWPKTAMRIGDWKIVANEPLTRFELYNVVKDPHEENNLAEREHDKFAEMRDALKNLNSEIEAEGPNWWKNYDNGGRPTTLPGPDALLSAKRVVFLGDSITYSGQYIAYLEAYLLSRYPGKTFDFIDLGLPSETVSGLSEPGHAGGSFPRPDLHERLERVLDKLKPDLIVACYGMNCGMYYPFSGERLQKYQAGIQKLRKVATAHGAQVIHLTPPTFDSVPLTGRTLPAGLDKYEQPYEGYNQVLGKFTEWLLGERQQGWTVIDIHGPMDLHLASRRQANPKFVLAGDGVHAGPTGHLLMTEQIILALNNAIVPIKAVIDATTPTCANPNVTELKKADDGLSLQWKCRVPLARDPNWDAESLAREHFTDKIDRYLLQINGLPAGDYELKEGDKVVAKFTAAEAAKGLDLLSAKDLTANQHAVELLKLISQRQRLQTDAWLNEVGHKRPGMAKGVPVAEADAKAAELQKQIHQLAQPVPLKLQVVKVK